MQIDNYSQLSNIPLLLEIPVNYLFNLESALNALIVGLEKNLDKLALAQASETKKPITYCYKEVQRCNAQILQARDYISSVLKYSYWNETEKIKYLPKGIILAISTFSSPYSSFFHKFLPSILCYDTFVYCPSPISYRCSQLLFDIVVSILKGQIPTIDEKMYLVNTSILESSEVLNRLSFDYILFTGKSETAAIIKKSIGYKHGTFETGSNALAYIDKSYDSLDELAKKLVNSAFAQSGQRCIGLKNLFIHEEIFDKLFQKIIKITSELQYGDPLDSKTTVGPLPETSISSIKKALDTLIDNGYILLYGGKFVENNVLIPTVLLDKSKGYVSIEELYGPVLCIHIIKSFLEIPKTYWYRSSLCTSCFSNDTIIIDEFIKHCNTSGSISINFGPDVRDDTKPFGGFSYENDGKEDLFTLFNELTLKQYIQYSKKDEERGTK